MMARSLPVLQRPHTRGECVDGPRPCPWASCRYSLRVLRVDRFGTPIEAHRATASCALDVADRGAHTLEQVAEALGGLTRERVRQVEEKALRRLRAAAAGIALQELRP